jgi:dTDP-4-amino-4,6-dideoxygalactose transaminase
MNDPIPWLDRTRAYRRFRPVLQPWLDRLLAEGGGVLVPAVGRFERAFADFVGARHCVAVNSGAAALRLALQAVGVCPGAEVITVPAAPSATAGAIAALGARPVFVDIERATYCMNPALIEPALTPRTKAIVPVHLYGQVADMQAILAVARRHGVAVVEDASHAHGATLHKRHAGTFGRAGCFSFAPGKNLGADGDAGAIVTNDADVADELRRLSTTSLMEAFTALVLSLKLPHVPAWTTTRRERARQYSAGLRKLRSLSLPVVPEGSQPCWHVYAVRTPNRTSLRRQLARWRIQTTVHYPTPLHLLPRYQRPEWGRGAFPIAEALCASQVTLPLFPELSEAEVAHVIDAVQAWAAAVGPAALVAA